jgi:hypothetical protein
MQVVLTVNVPTYLSGTGNGALIPQTLIADRMQKAADKMVFWNSNPPTPLTVTDSQGNTLYSWVITAT